MSAFRPTPVALLAFAAALIAAAAFIAAGSEAKPKPKPPKPQVTVLTASEEGALRTKSIKVLVEGKRGKASAEGTMLVDGYPEDYNFKLGPDGKKLKGGEAKLRFGLSPRKLEVLDFAIKTCRGTTVTVTGKVAGRSRTRSADLALPSGC